MHTGFRVIGTPGGRDGGGEFDDGTAMNLIEGSAGSGGISSASPIVLGGLLSTDALLPSSLSPSANLPSSPVSPPFRCANHPNIPLGSGSSPSNNARFDLGLENPNINDNGVSSTFGNVSFMQDSATGGLAQRSLTRTLPTISSLRS